jgi:hypothetical protein
MPVSLSTLLEAIGESNLHALFFTQLLDLITERQITFQQRFHCHAALISIGILSKRFLLLKV